MQNTGMPSLPEKLCNEQNMLENPILWPTS